MSRPTGTPAWARRSDLVVCIGGPRDGAWYFAPDLATAEQAAVTVATRTGRAAPSHGYRDTGVGLSVGVLGAASHDDSGGLDGERAVVEVEGVALDPRQL